MALCLILVFSTLSSVYIYADAPKEFLAEAEERKELPIQSDQTLNWPAGPKIGAEGALLMEANTGSVLYSKNIDEKLYPASVTKMLTALVVLDNCKLDEMVTFSQEAIDSINWREDANIGISPGNSITVEQCLYGLLVGSANEVAYALAEHVSGPGNLPAFADLMNEYAKNLGCTNSHFVTPNGIHNEDHYTSCHDLGLIAKEFFANELLCKMSSTTSYKIPKTSTQPRDDMVVYAKSKLHPGKEYAYDNLVGTKTGYTDIARQTLVSCAEKDGFKLICVIMKEEDPYQFTDTITLFDYGFDNFTAVNIADNDTKYSIQSLNFFSTKSDFFGSSKPILQIDPADYILLPVGEDFSSVTSSLSYDGLEANELARVNYYYNDAFVGFASIVAASEEAPVFDFGEKKIDTETEVDEDNILVINITKVIGVILLIAVVLVIVFIVRSKVNASTKWKRRKSLRRYVNSRTDKLDWKHFK